MVSKVKCEDILYHLEVARKAAEKAKEDRVALQLEKIEKSLMRRCKLEVLRTDGVVIRRRKG